MAGLNCGSTLSSIFSLKVSAVIADEKYGTTRKPDFATLGLLGDDLIQSEDLLRPESRAQR